MSAHVLLIFGNSDKIRDLPRILLLLATSLMIQKHNVRFYISNYIKMTLESHFWRKKVYILSLCMQRCSGRHFILLPNSVN